MKLKMLILKVGWCCKTVRVVRNTEEDEDLIKY